MQNNPYLSGYFEPVHDELAVKNLAVIGKIPEDLTGIYMRNGPNPDFPPLSYTYPFDGDGMIHAVYLANGKAHYRNRFVETKGLLKERKAGKALYGGIANMIPMDPQWAGAEDEPFAIKNGAFIHIIRHAGQYLALWEGGPGYQMTEQLDTIGEWNPENSTPLSVCAHTRLDPKSGELWFINYALVPPYLSVYCVDNKGAVIKKMDIEKDYSTMIHDFVLTKNYVVIFDCPVVLDLNQLMSGGPLLDWRPELGVRVGIIPRQGGKVKWFTTEPFFVFHFANAYEQDKDIIIDFVRRGGGFAAHSDKKDIPPMLYRTVINVETGVIKHKQLDDRLVEFPRIKEDVDTEPHQFVYTPTKTSDIDATLLGLNALVKYDVKNGTSDVHEFGKFAQVGEAVFAPKPTPQSEDDGYLMLFVYDSASAKSEFVILDAKHFTAPPLARIQMPQRVPSGLHGSWMPGSWLW